LSKQHKIMLGGVELIPDVSGALFVPEYQTLIISDLHLEQGTSLARRGIHVPPFDTAITLRLLEQVVEIASPKQLIFLGDSFHDDQGETRLDDAHTKTLRGLTSAHETIWICGNHDPEPPQDIGGQGADVIALGPLTLRHEPSGSEFEIAGHLHPGCGINQRGRRLYGKCFVADDKRLIMPAFGAYTGGLSVSSPAFRGLFSSTAKAWMIGRSAIHPFPFSAVT
jgi:uncharacterized protein